MLQRVLSQSSVEHFLSLIAGNFCRGTLSSNIILRHRKKLCFKGLCHGFLPNFFCLTVLKLFVQEPFCAVFPKNSGREKVYG